MELSFHMIRLRHASRNEATIYEKVLNDIYTQITELSDTRTGSEESPDTPAKLIAAVRDIDVLAIVCRNLSGTLQELNSSFRAFVFEVD